MQHGIRMQLDHVEITGDSYLHSMMMAGIVAATETSTHAMSNAMKLLRHPDMRCENFIPGLHGRRYTALLANVLRKPA